MARRLHKPATVLEIAQFSRRPGHREPNSGNDASQEETGTPVPQQSDPLILESPTSIHLDKGSDIGRRVSDSG